MSRTEKLEHGKYYHIFNRGINGCDLFREPDNYDYFMRLYEKYIESAADTYAWVLMKNHFHFLIKLNAPSDLSGLENLEGLKPPHQHFSNLFNAYTKAFNKKYERTGSLFEKNFHRKEVSNIEYLKKIIVYIHQNPVHHRFCEHPSDYPWSSYLSCISVKNTRLKRDAVIGWFDNPGKFKFYHEKLLATYQIEDFLEI